MSLTFEQQYKCSIPVSVRGITPDKTNGQTLADIERLPIRYGNQQAPLAEYFNVKQHSGLEHVWQGPLENVHEIGAGMTTGRIRIDSTAGRHVGQKMSGGEIRATSDVGDYLGCEMSGGTIRIAGNSGNSVGGCLPGSASGMNRGVILIDGNAGIGVGQQMRRGLIAVAGSTLELTGWHMRAGTILTLGRCGKRAGAEMKRGTIIAATADSNLAGPTFRAGPVGRPPVINLIARWLLAQGFEFDIERLAGQNFFTYAGDVLHGGRGELFVATG